MNREEFLKECRNYKNQVANLCNEDVYITEEQYEIIKHVYMWYPGLSKIEGKQQVAALYMHFGISIFNDMYDRAEKAMMLNQEAEKERTRHETEMERIHEEQKKLVTYMKKKECEPLTQPPASLSTLVHLSMYKIAKEFCEHDVEKRLKANDYKHIIYYNCCEMLNDKKYSLNYIKERLYNAIGTLAEDKILQVSSFLLCEGATTEDRIYNIINLFIQ